jgi:hypothetical protein
MMIPCGVGDWWGGGVVGSQWLHEPLFCVCCQHECQAALPSYCKVAVEGLASQTPKPLNRPLIPLSEHQKFMNFLKYLENPQKFSRDKSCPKEPESNVSFSKL